MKYFVNFEIDLKKNPYKGLYIALEGIDGSGKSTQVELLAKHFESEGREVFKTHEPRRDTVVGTLIHEILQSEVKVSPVSLQYLFAADRAIHQEQMVLPALEAGKVVISDRSFWSSIPYGLLDRFEAGHEENGDRLLAALSILSMYHEFVAPDVAIYLDVSTGVASDRLSHLNRKAEIYENSDKLDKIRNGYEWLFEKFPEVFTRIHGENDETEITQEILDATAKLQK